MNHKFSDSLLHPFIYEGEVPQKLNNPFNYTEHPISEAAIKHLIPSVDSLMKNIDEGKMFAVLVVMTQEDLLANSSKYHYLAAFSGQINDKSIIPGFVPPIFNLLNPDGYFKINEKRISNINHEIEKILHSEEYLIVKHEYDNLKSLLDLELDRVKSGFKQSKIFRDKLRAERKLTKEEEKKLIKESQFQKAELKRIKRRCDIELAKQQEKIDKYERQIEVLKSKRRKYSEALQNWIFSQYKLVNFKAEEKNILEIFSNTILKVPPSGTGDCCEPKLLQYAYTHNLIPIQMAMFWWGKSPKKLIRHHLGFYPACSEKCKPILEYMLPPEVFTEDFSDMNEELSILYEDSHCWIVNKPSGMLSVPGKSTNKSVISRLFVRAKENELPLEVHRLDMDTSGILIVAKNAYAQSLFRKMFENREVKKKYLAVLSGDTLNIGDYGEISLPLVPDFTHRPYQKVDEEFGKSAITRYRVIGEHLVELEPLTGRTHQLRVHCAHSEGLSRPIVGDKLYGTRAERLHLYAVRIEFVHPISNENIVVETKDIYDTLR